MAVPESTKRWAWPEDPYMGHRYGMAQQDQRSFVSHLHRLLRRPRIWHQRSTKTSRKREGFRNKRRQRWFPAQGVLLEQNITKSAERASHLRRHARRPSSNPRQTLKLPCHQEDARRQRLSPRYGHQARSRSRRQALPRAFNHVRLRQVRKNIWPPWEIPTSNTNCISILKTETKRYGFCRWVNFN